MNLLKSARKLKIVVPLGLIALILALATFGIFSAHEHKKASKEIESPKKALYFCPMHPSVTSDKPGRCPICHMPLEKMEEYPDAMPEKTQDVPGRVSFSLPKERQQLIGVTTEKVANRELSYEIRASGKVAFDPDLFTTLEEHLQALDAQKEMSKSPFKELRLQADALVSSSQTKLKLMGLSQNQIEMIGKESHDPINLLLPKGSVWIYAEVFEYEISLLKSGQALEVTAPSLPGKTFTGTISSISPIVNAPSRTFRVRGEVPNPDGILKPDTFVNVKIRIELGKRLSVPMSALLHSGDKNFVFVVKGKGKFEPRLVSVVMRAGQYYEILSGLMEEETVVTSANFLIDSEARLRSASGQEGQQEGQPKGQKEEPPKHHH
jgi:Cu(I)/Ag(I) efflux system membrane fusion protein